MMFGNVRKGVKHVVAALLFCLIMSAALVCFADEKGTVTADSAKVREKADTSSKQVGSAKKGATVDILGEETGADGKTWYQVSVDGNVKGYVRSDLIKKSGQTAGGNANAAVTPTDAKTGTVTTNSVHVRKEASTNSTDVATVSKGIVLTVTGESQGSDGKKWYQVTFKHNDKDVGGFIRADLVTFENVPADPAVSEITGTGGENGETPPETQPPETQEQPQPENNSNNSSANENEGIIFMNVEEEPYVMPGFEVVALDWNGQKINAYRNGTFFIVYAQKQNGEEGWYLLDREKNIYQRYPYTVENVTVPKAGMLSGNVVPMIVMAVVIVIMLVVVVVLILKLNRSGGYYEDDDEDDYPDDEEDDDIEDIGEEIARKPLLRRSAQPVRQEQTEVQSGQSARRPAQMQNRQEPLGQQSRQEQSGQIPVRRPAQPQNRQEPVGSQSGQSARRPIQPQNRQEPLGQQDRPGQRRPSPQGSRPAPNAHSQRGKNDDDDMNFIDV